MEGWEAVGVVSIPGTANSAILLKRPR